EREPIFALEMLDVFIPRFAEARVATAGKIALAELFERGGPLRRRQRLRHLQPPPGRTLRAAENVVMAVDDLVKLPVDRSRCFALAQERHEPADVLGRLLEQ